MSNIERFKQQIRKGLTRPNRYLVNITFPAGLQNQLFSIVNNNAKDLSILCESVELPGSLIATNEDKQFGPFRKMPYINVFNDLTLVFMCDEDMLARSIFDAWQSMIVSKENFKVNYYEDYIATAEISLLSEHGEGSVGTKLYTLRCHECYPIEVVTQNLSYSEVDTYLKVEVKMAYRFWEKIS